jgi:hypothetical protein
MQPSTRYQGRTSDLPNGITTVSLQHKPRVSLQLLTERTHNGTSIRITPRRTKRLRGWLQDQFRLKLSKIWARAAARRTPMPIFDCLQH